MSESFSGQGSDQCLGFVYRLVQFWWRDVWNIYADPRTLPYIKGGPWDLVTIVGIYLGWVLYFGPKFMAYRKPYQLNNVLRYYNLINIIINTVYCSVAFYYTRFTYDCWGSEDKPIHIYLTLLGGLGYMYIKVLDLLDTVFFVLRKKYGQVTFLHVSHHVSTQVE